MPKKLTFAAKYEEDLIRFYAENYDNIIWEKVEDAEEIRQAVEMYLEDPNALEFEQPKKQ